MSSFADEPLPPHTAVRALRLARGLSLREVARRLGVSPATLSALENGHTGFSVTRLTELATVLGVPAHELLSGSADPPAPQAGQDGAGATPAGDWRSFGPLDTDPVLRAAISLFVELGYHGTTVRALAARAGTSVPGLYHHYRDKQDLLVRILDLTMDELHERVRAACAQGRDSLERVRLIVEALALFHTHRRELGFIGASEMRSLAPLGRARIAKSRSALQQLLDDEIAAAGRSGRIGTPDHRAAGRAIATMCTGISQWYRDGGSATPEDIAARYGRFALAMLDAEPSAFQREGPPRADG